MAKYLLLLYDDPSHWAKLKPEEIKTAIGKYRAWGDKLRQNRIYLGSHKLTEEPGKVVRGRRNGKPRITDGPYSETKEVLGGYYLIEAANYDQAVESTRDCPHLEYGGTIEVRQVDELMGSQG
jgi:hypothetical protein